MTKYDIVNNICDNNNGIVTSSMLRESGVETWYLSDMVKKGILERVGRGIYSTKSGDYDEYFYFQIINKRCIYSYLSALYLHGMTDRIPYSKEVTVYKGYNGTHISDDVIIHYVNKDIYELGITKCETVFGNTVQVYSKERTICDLIKNRKTIDVEVFSQAIKEYANNPERDYKKLRVYAKAMKIEEKLDDILEVL